MKNLLLFLLSVTSVGTSNAQSHTTVFETSSGKETATYQQVIDFYTRLDEVNPTIQVQKMGQTDAGEPLRVVFYSGQAKFDLSRWKIDGKTIILINNGIHPGEPDGIDASMMLLRDAASGKIKVPDNVVLAVIPVFNIGGALNRNEHSRANQNGPASYGFRGSAQNLDLNRDFIKMDARETRELVGIMRTLDPEIFIDNHVSNGADYQHVMTLLSTQHNKLGGITGKYLHDTLEPMIYREMKSKGYDMVPYVNFWGDEGVEKGWKAFYEGPRFASGYAALFQAFAFVPETHMLKPYKQRVEATYALMQVFIDIAGKHGDAIRNTKAMDRQAVMAQKEFAIDWVADKDCSDSITFKGYQSGKKASEVSGQPRLYYDRAKPYTKQIPYYNNCLVNEKVKAPAAYIVPQGWGNVVDRLHINHVEMKPLQRDTTLTVTVYYIDDYETVKTPYEGHYLHSKVKLRSEKKTLKVLKGDYMVSLNQPAKRYLVETLEPNAPDAFFAWGFFDAILQQKEHFSSYVFEDTGAEILKKNAALRQQLEAKKKSDPAFAKNAEAQLEFVYRHSDYYEPVHMRYPVFRIEE